MSRIGLSKKTRFEVFKRDGFLCGYCGSHPPDAILEVDHVVPVAEGGGNEMDNLITACFACNRGKSDTPLRAVPASLKEKAELIKEREEQLEGYTAIRRAQQDRIERDMWEVADTLENDASTEGMRRDWLQSIKKFLEHLDVTTMVEAAQLARARKPYSSPQRFRYFCGICWNKIRRDQ